MPQSQQIIIWGTGQLVMKLLAETSLGQANITAFIDNNPINQGKNLHGVKIHPPEALYGFNEPILITTVLHQEAIAKQIQKMGISNELIFLME